MAGTYHDLNTHDARQPRQEGDTWSMAGPQDGEMPGGQDVNAGRDAYIAGRDMHVHLPPATEPVSRDEQLLRQAATSVAEPPGASAEDAVWIDLSHELESRLDLDYWNYHIGGLLRTFPKMRRSSNERLHHTARWLQGRVFPGNHKELQRIFAILPKVIIDLLAVFGEHYEVPLPDQDDPWLRTEQFYKLDRGNPNAERRYHDHVNLLSDLALELTRAVNWFCATVRRDLDPTFRLQQGAVLVEGGPFEPDGDTRWFRPEYSPAELSAAVDPYITLDDFMSNRYARDLHTEPTSQQ